MVKTRSGRRADPAPERESLRDQEQHSELDSAQDVKSGPIEPLKEWDVGQLIDRSLVLSDLKELAIGHRPGHEFVSVRSQSLHGHFAYIFRCCEKTCNVARYIISNASKNDFLLFEDGEHESGHSPACRRRYPYTRAQDSVIQSMFVSNKQVSNYNADKILKELKRQNLVRGLTIRQLRSRLTNANTKRIRLAQDNQNLYIRELLEFQQTARENTDLAQYRNDPNATLLLPLRRGDHVTTGDDVIDDTPKTTRGGKKLSICFPFTTLALLRNCIKARDQELEIIDLESLLDLDTRPLRTTPVENEGYCQIDVVHNLVRSRLKLIHIGTVCNGHWRLFGVSVVSGETQYNITATLDAFDRAAQALLHDEGRSNWIMTDSGAAVTAGIRDFLGVDVPHGTCGQHFIAKNLPELKKWMPVKGRPELYATVREFMEGLRMFPPEIFFGFWPVIRRHFITDLKLKRFTESLDNLYFKKSSG